MAGRVSDWYFMNGNTLEGIAEQVGHPLGRRRPVTDVDRADGADLRVRSQPPAQARRATLSARTARVATTWSLTRPDDYP